MSPTASDPPTDAERPEPPGQPATPARPGPTDRGVSFVLSHVVTLGIATVVVTGLLYSAGGFVAEERAETTRGELSAVGTALVGDLAAADRAVDGAADATLVLRTSAPPRVAGGSYRVALETAGECPNDGPSTACLELRASSTDVEVALPFRNETPVANGSATGGQVAIAYRDGTLSIEDRP